jgi:uncharacterized protein YraI
MTSLRLRTLTLLSLLTLAGCSSSAPAEEEFVFTADDAARFDQLVRQAGTETGVVLSAASGTVLSAGSVPQGTGVVLQALSSSSVAAFTPQPVDPTLVSRYSDLRRETPLDGRQTFVVTNAFVNLREAPDRNAALIGRLEQGASVELVEFTNADWVRVRTMEAEGYVSLQYVAKMVQADRLEAEKQTYAGTYFVDFAFLNVRQSADKASAKLGELPGRALVKPLAMTGEWAQVPFNGGTGFVAAQYLTPFLPNFTIRQDSFQIPILLYRADQQGFTEALTQHVKRLKEEGFSILTFAQFRDALEAQQKDGQVIGQRSVLLGVTGVSLATVKTVSDALLTAGTRATLFVPTRNVGLSGLTQKSLSSLVANGYDVQSEGHTGDDLRALTNAQLDLELRQSRQLLTEAGATVFAIAYPQSGVNDRVMQRASEAGYLFGVGALPERLFRRSQFLRLPSFAVSTSMSATEVLRLVSE